jgi:hypothetical protein
VKELRSKISGEKSVLFYGLHCVASLNKLQFRLFSPNSKMLAAAAAALKAELKP